MAEELPLVLVELAHGQAAVAVAALDATLVVRRAVKQDDLFSTALFLNRMV